MILKADIINLCDIASIGYPHCGDMMKKIFNGAPRNQRQGSYPYAGKFNRTKAFWLLLTPLKFKIMIGTYMHGSG